MNIQLQFVLSIFVCWTFVSCIKVEPKNKNESEPSPAPVIETTSAVTALVRGLDEPNKYIVEFQQGEGLFVRKIRHGVSSVLRIDDKNTIDSDVQPGDQITYQFSREFGSSQMVLKTIDVAIPRDLVFEKKLILNETTIKQLSLELDVSGSFRRIKAVKFRRIFFMKESLLVTNGEYFQIVADEIRFHQSQIWTHEPGQVAALGQFGRSGGTLDFHAKKISGEVQIELRGENGGQGLEGALPDDKLKGANGYSGDKPIVTIPPMCPSDQLSCGTCQSPGTPGGPGQDGREGYPGGRGFRGGSSGELRWQAEDIADLNWKVLKFPGQGGVGGSGGAGGAGGQGGTTMATMFCPPIAPAQDGQKGPLGPSGIPGESGLLESACLQTPDERICR